MRVRAAHDPVLVIDHEHLHRLVAGTGPSPQLPHPGGLGERRRSGEVFAENLGLSAGVRSAPLDDSKCHVPSIVPWLLALALRRRPSDPPARGLERRIHGCPTIGKMTITSSPDGVVIAVECGATKWQVVDLARGKIEQVGGKVLGVILNKRKYNVPRMLYGRV